MKKMLILLPLVSSFIFAQTVKSKEMRAEDKPYAKNYENSSNIKTTEDRVISSTAEASAQITVTVTLQITSEMTSGKTNNIATISFLDNNRMQITEDIAKGEGEHLETLLSMMNLPSNHESLVNIQNHLENLIYLSHNNFLTTLKTLV